MKLTEEDISDIAELLPAPEEGLPEIAELAGRFEDVRHSRLFSAAAILQLSVFGFPRDGLSIDLRLPNRTREITFGFIPIGPSLHEQIEAQELVCRSSRFTFGISIHAESTSGEADQYLMSQVGFAGRSFPVVVTHSQLIRDGIPPHPDKPSKLGTSACWAKSNNKQSGWKYGVLTARHVVEQLSKGAQVDLDQSVDHSTPTSGWIADLGACSIDAAIVKVKQSDWPTGLSPLSIGGPYSQPIAAGVNVELSGRLTPQNACKVVSHHPLEHFWGSMMGQRLIIDGFGQSGDRGGLVKDSGNGAGVGLYMGRIPDGAGGEQGLCQDLYQASVYLEADFYL